MTDIAIGVELVWQDGPGRPDDEDELRTRSSYTGKVNDEIAVRASDDFEVMGVAVAIANGSGQAIDAKRGAATETPTGSGRWVASRKATQAVPTGTAVRFTVTATDRPGHTGVKSAMNG